MTTPKPPVPSDLQYIYDHAEGGHDEGMAALWLAGYHARNAEQLPPPPTDPDDERIVDQLAARREGEVVRLVPEEQLRLAQHSAHQRGQTVAAQERRIAELESSLSVALKGVEHWREMYREVDLERVKANRRATELEVEIDLVGREGEGDRQAAAALRDKVRALRDSIPRRTPELEAEVAELREKLKREKDMCNALAYMNPTHTARRTPELTERVVDAIFGKRPLLSRLDAIHAAHAVLDLVSGKEQE